MQGRRSTRIAAAALALGLLAGAACSGSSPTGGHPSTAATVSRGVDGGPITLTVWDQDVRAAQQAEITKLNRLFKAKYPNVTIRRVARSFVDLKSRLQSSISGGQLPDVVQVNQGWADMGQLVRAGLLRPLDAYARLYGWDRRYPRALLDFNSFSADGSQFGAGSLFGLSQEGELVGVYYNKEKLHSLKIKVPQSFGQFEAALRKAKQGGETPLQFGNLDKFPGIHIWQALQNEFTPPKDLRDLVLGRGDISFDTPENLRAASKLREWVAKGYFARDFDSTAYDDAWKSFTRGQGVFLITGTWLAGDLGPRMGGKVGFFPMPPVNAGASSVATGGEGLAFAITDQSRHPDTAAAYIDMLTNARAERVIVEAGGLPAMSLGTRVPSGGLLHAIVAAWRTISAHDDLVPYLDYATPTFYATITAGVQNLMSGLDTPQRFLHSLQENYSTFQGLR
jgi:raffinose/stachyose/melibiose transport system substrate-binding protein